MLDTVVSSTDGPDRIDSSVRLPRDVVAGQLTPDAPTGGSREHLAGRLVGSLNSPEVPAPGQAIGSRSRVALRSINEMTTSHRRIKSAWLAELLADDQEVAVPMADGAVVLMRILGGRVEAAMTIPNEAIL